MNVLIVDDEALARSRLRTLLGECQDPRLASIFEASSATQALDLIERESIDLLLLDIGMPGKNGMALAEQLQRIASKAAVIFVTAHPEHALQAFEVQALDYLTKPVRLARLQQALQKFKAESSEDAAHLVIQERSRVVRVALKDVLYIKAELKYLTVRTASASHLLEGSLTDLEEKHAHIFVRVHRNALVAKQAVTRLERGQDNSEGEVWQVQLQGIEEPVTVSRRQLSKLRHILTASH